MLVTLLFFLIITLNFNTFGMIPSSHGENTLSVGVGIGKEKIGSSQIYFLHGSGQLFYAPHNNLGFGMGMSGNFFGIALISNNYYQLRILNTKEVSASIFFENIYIGSIFGASQDNAIGLGISLKSEHGSLNSNLSFNSKTSSTFKYGLISGAEYVWNNGYFIGYSPSVTGLIYVGYKGPLRPFVTTIIPE